jgi:hypothetical protein
VQSHSSRRFCLVGIVTNSSRRDLVFNASLEIFYRTGPQLDYPEFYRRRGFPANDFYKIARKSWRVVPSRDRRARSREDWPILRQGSAKGAGSAGVSEPEQYFPLPADDRCLADSILDLAEGVSRTDLGAEGALADQCGDFAE